MTWYDQVLPLAQQASTGTGLPVSVILAQWALESARGNSALAHENNLAGIEFTGKPGSYNADGRSAGYNSPGDFLRDYVRVLNLPFYDHLKAAASQGGPEAVIRGFTAAPPGVPRYAEDTAYSDKLIAILRGDNLTRYDSAQVPQLAAMQDGNTIRLQAGSLPALSPKVLGAVAAAAGAVILLAIASD